MAKPNIPTFVAKPSIKWDWRFARIVFTLDKPPGVSLHKVYLKNRLRYYLPDPIFNHKLTLRPGDEVEISIAALSDDSPPMESDLLIEKITVPPKPTIRGGLKSFTYQHKKPIIGILTAFVIMVFLLMFGSTSWRLVTRSFEQVISQGSTWWKDKLDTNEQTTPPPDKPSSIGGAAFITASAPIPITRVQGTNGSRVEVNIPQGGGFSPQIFAVAGGNITLQTPSIGGESKRFEVKRAQPQGFDVRVGENRVVPVMPHQTIHVETAEGWSLDWKEVNNKASLVRVLYDFQDQPQLRNNGTLNCSVLSLINDGTEQLTLVFEWTRKL